MTEYKENTVGWHLNRLKEPLRTRVLADHALRSGCIVARTMHESMCQIEPHVDIFYLGVKDYFFNPTNLPKSSIPRYLSGWLMAKECAPDPEVVNPPIDLVSTGLGVMDAGSHPRLTYEPMEVVEGYTPPLPVETIEGRHDRELKEQAARIASLEQRNAVLEHLVEKIMDYITSERGVPL